MKWLQRSTWALLVLLAASWLQAAPAPPAQASIPSVTRPQHVVLLHGLGLSRHWMMPLARKLKKAGFVVHNWSYPSRKHDLQGLVEHVGPWLRERIPEDAEVSLVGFSLGGVVVRGLLNSSYRPHHVRRVVFLGAPHQGSAMANFWCDMPILRGYFGPAAQQLKIAPEAQAARDGLGAVHVPALSIAGDWTIDPISMWVLQAPHDGKVPVSSTQIPHIGHHLTLSASHTTMVFRTKVHDAVIHFLQQQEEAH